MLLISIGLLVTAINGQEGSHPGPLKKFETPLVSIQSESNTVKIGDEIQINGFINPSLFGGSQSDTIILISAPDGSLADSFVLSSPNQHGQFTYSIPADVGGIWGFEALYNGINSERIEIKAEPSGESGRTTLTLTGWPSYPRTGENVTFKGRLTDASGKGISEREVVYETALYRDECISGCIGENIDEWSPEGSVVTDKGGEYQFTMVREGEEGFDVRAVFPGDEEYHSSSSRVIAIKILNT